MHYGDVGKYARSFDHHTKVKIMAMRPHVKRNSLLIVAFAITQCVIIQTSVHQHWFDLSYSARVACFTISGIVCATLLFFAALYAAVLGNSEKYDT